MKYFVYKHTRLDINVPFYIGIGTAKQKETHKSKYQRAYTKFKRNFMWARVVNKTSYQVDIVFETDSQIEVKTEEIRLIALYGRRDKGKGSLVNNTDGGDGRLAPNKESMINVGKNLSHYHNLSRKTIYQYNLDGVFLREWSCITECALELSIDHTGIIACARGKIRKYKDFLWSYVKQEQALRDKLPTGKSVIQYTKDGVELNSFTSLSEAVKSTGVSLKSISQCVTLHSKTAGGYKWSFS